jgi:hypothetical protein
MQYPIFGAVLAPVNMVARVYFSTPFLGLVIFFVIYLGIVNNQSLARSVRFNGLQAVLLDIILMCAPHIGRRWLTIVFVCWMSRLELYWRNEEYRTCHLPLYGLGDQTSWDYLPAWLRA